MSTKQFFKVNSFGIATLKSFDDIPLVIADALADGWKPYFWEIEAKEPEQVTTPVQATQPAKRGRPFGAVV